MAGRVYSIVSAIFTPGANRTMLEFMAAAERQVLVRRVELSSDDTAGSTVVDVTMRRITVTGTGTSVTPAPFDNSSTAGLTAKYNDTAEPTSGTTLWAVKWNIQVPYTMVLGPGEEFFIPGATNEGFAIYSENPASSIQVSLIVEEV